MNKILKKLNIILITTLLFFLGINSVYADSAKISVSSSTSRIVVGNTFNVTVTVSSGSPLGTWKYTISYDSSKFKKVSGEQNVVDYADGKIKSRSYTYKFKAIATGSGNISVKAASATLWSGNSEFVPSISSKTVKVITQAELEASYSKNNNLKSLSITGLTLSPTFNKNTLEYTANASANTNEITIKAACEDSKSHVSGTGTHEVSEGENKINLIVTAENGSTKTYTVKVNVTDPNPIIVNVDNKEFTVVKRESNLNPPVGFEKKELELDGQKVPSFYNEINNYTLVGLKDEAGEISFYIYDNDKYTKYTEASLETIKLLPLEFDKKLDSEYIKSTTIIDEVTFDSYKIKNSDYSIIHARNLTNGKDNYYIYDSIENNIIRYTDENTKPLKDDISKYKKLILLLGIETVVIIIVLIFILISNISKKKKRKILYEQELKKKELEKELIIQEEQKKQEEKIQQELKKKKETKKKGKTITKNEKK